MHIYIYIYIQECLHVSINVCVSACLCTYSYAAQPVKRTTKNTSVDGVFAEQAILRGATCLLLAVYIYIYINHRPDWLVICLCFSFQVIYTWFVPCVTYYITCTVCTICIYIYMDRQYHECTKASWWAFWNPPSAPHAKSGQSFCVRCLHASANALL